MKHMLVALGVLGFVSVAALAQTEEAKPGSKLKMWDFWAGKWSFEGQEKDSPSGTERTSQTTAEGRWMSDFFFEFRGQWKDPDGKEMGNLIITGYDPIKKAYFSANFRSDGWKGTSSVTFGEKTVTEDWTGVTATGEKTRWRCTYGFSDQDNTETCETLTDGKWWVSSKGTWTRVK